MSTLKRAGFPRPLHGHLSLLLSQMFEENGVELGASKDVLREVYLLDVFLDRSTSPSCRQEV